jgi:DNA primase
MKTLTVNKTLKVGNILDELEKDSLKTKINLSDLFSSFGVHLERKGKSFMGCCPFHDDKTPSLSVDPEKGLYHCFGCGESGDAFDLVMRMKGFTFPEALNYLKGGFFPAPSPTGTPVVSVPLESPEEGIFQGQRAEETPEAETAQSRPALKPVKKVSFDEVADHWRKNLSESKEAQNYLKERGIFHPETLQRLKAGFSSGSLLSALSDGQKESLKAAGIITESGREAFTECVVFPLFDESGRTASFYGRKISDSGKIKHLYPAGPHKGLLNREAFKVYPERMILTESVIDAVSLMVLGIQNVTACYGTNSFTDDHLSALKEARTKEVVIAFDADDAGKQGAEKLKGKLLAEGFSVRIVSPEGVKDWNSFLSADQSADLSGGFTRETFDVLLSASQVFEPEGKARLRVEEKAGRFVFTSGPVIYRITGVKEGFLSSLKVNVRAEKESSKLIDNVDLYSARSRSLFSYQLSKTLVVEPARVESDLVSILEWLEADRDRKLLGTDSSAVPELTEQEREAGLSLLTDPDLFNRIEADLSALGYVGEKTNKLLVYLAASSRKMADPMSVIVISQSSAGKSFLVDTVKKCIPPEDLLSMTSLSDQALNYLPEESLLHKFLILGEAVHSDAVDHQMREMLSGKELSRLVTVKDEKTGRMESRLVRKKVIVSAVMSSTSHEINPENASRCFVVSSDETEEQTKAIHREQRKKYSLERYERKETFEPEIIRSHHAAQRLLTNRIIVNPFAEKLDFPASLMRSRRDHERFLDLIACVCFLRQYQKEEKETDGKRFIESDLADYRIAHDIMMKILPSTLTNFPSSARMVHESVRKIIEWKAGEEDLSFHEVSVTQREIREDGGFDHNLVKRALRLLVEYEYLEQKGGNSRGGRAFYRLSQNAPLSLSDLSSIPNPEEMAKRVKSGSFV